MLTRAILVGVVVLALGSSGRAHEPAPDHADEALRDTTSAMTSASSWLGLVDGAKYGESWEVAAKLFREATTRAGWVKAVAAARAPLGKVLARKLKGSERRTSLPGAPDGEYVVIQFNTSFANKKYAVETVTPMRDADGTWRVSGYFVR